MLAAAKGVDVDFLNSEIEKDA